MLYRLRHWTAVQRTPQNNRELGFILCFVAGATNAGGFLAVGQYTSHMSGVVSAMADHAVLGQFKLLLVSIAMLFAFLAGAMTTTWMVHWALRRQLASAYGGPLLLEAALLLVFGLFGAGINAYADLFVPLTVLLLCFIMGLQNSVMTIISKTEIRTTHITGLVTDLGIELGQLLYVNRFKHGNQVAPLVMANRPKLRMHLMLIASFLAGGLLGAIGFQRLGYITTLPLGLMLLMLSLYGLLVDMKRWRAPIS